MAGVLFVPLFDLSDYIVLLHDLYFQYDLILGGAMKIIIKTFFIATWFITLNAHAFEINQDHQVVILNFNMPFGGNYKEKSPPNLELHIDRMGSKKSNLYFLPQPTGITKIPLVELPLNRNWKNELKIGGNYIQPYFGVFAADGNKQQNDIGEYILMGLGIAAIVGILLAIDDVRVCLGNISEEDCDLSSED